MFITPMILFCIGQDSDLIIIIVIIIYVFIYL